MSEDDEAGPPPERVVRLLFRMRDGVPELVSRQTTEMVLPEADEAPDAAMGAALTFELRDADQNTLLQRALDEHMPGSHEVFSPDSTIGRVEDPAPTGAFEVLVPDLPNAEIAALVAMDPNLGAAMGANEKTFRLSDVPEDDDLDDEPEDDEGGEP